MLFLFLVLQLQLFFRYLFPPSSLSLQHSAENVFLGLPGLWFCWDPQNINVTVPSFFLHLSQHLLWLAPNTWGQLHAVSVCCFSDRAWPRSCRRWKSKRCRQTFPLELIKNPTSRPLCESQTSPGWCCRNVGQEDSLETWFWEALFFFLWLQRINRLLYDKWPTREQLCVCVCVRSCLPVCVCVCVWRPTLRV